MRALVILTLLMLVVVMGLACAASIRSMPGWMPSEPLTEPLQLVVYPQVTMSSPVRVYPTAARDPRNRWIVVELILPGFGRVEGKLYQLDGDRAPTIFPDWWLSHLAPGEYAVVATLIRADGSQVRRERALTVAGGD